MSEQEFRRNAKELIKRLDDAQLASGREYHLLMADVIRLEITARREGTAINGFGSGPHQRGARVAAR